MKRFTLYALIGLAAVAPPAARAQDGIVDLIQSGLDEIARSVNRVGQKAEDLLGPGLNLREEVQARHTERRVFQDRYPIGPNALISITNEFGEVRVDTWSERVVQVSAEIIMGAETADQAAELARTVNIDVTDGEAVLDVRTRLPDTHGQMGVVSKAVNYVVTVPADASVIVDNFFGDTYVQDVGGLTAVENQYGLVDLSGLSGPVRVRSHGEFPVLVAGLAQGGEFDINGGDAELSEISGTLRVNCFRGSVSVQELADAIDIDITATSAPIRIVLPPDSAPDITAAALYGDVRSELTLQRTAQGDTVVARRPSADSTQRVALTTTFSDIEIAQAREQGATPEPSLEDAEPFNDILSLDQIAAPGATLEIDAGIGDIRLEPTEGHRVRVVATRIVWVEKPSAAPPALEALRVQLQRKGDRLSLDTFTAEDMPGLGAASYRTDLVVRVPLDIIVDIRAQDGQTRLDGLPGAITVNQRRGSIYAKACSGTLKLNSEEGDLTVEASDAAIEASARFGNITIDGVTGKVDTQCLQGQTLIDGPGGDVTARNVGGDIRILALGGVRGPFDIRVEDGNLSMLLDPAADASLSLAATNGQVHSVHPLTGAITQETREFRGRLRDGRYPIRLQSTNGSIYLD